MNLTRLHLRSHSPVLHDVQHALGHEQDLRQSERILYTHRDNTKPKRCALGTDLIVNLRIRLKGLSCHLYCVVIASSMRPGRQEDAHEFLRELVESFQKSALHHSILPHPYNVSPPSSPSVANPNKVPPALAETSWVHKVFGGKLRSRVTCHSCGYNSDKFEACLDISLDLAGARSVESAFENYVKVEQLDGKGADRYKCEKSVHLLRSLPFSGLLLLCEGVGMRCVTERWPAS